MWSPSGRGGVFYVIAQLGLLALIVSGPKSMGVAEAWPGPWGWVATVVGVVLLIAAGLFVIVGAYHLGPNLSPLPRPKDDAQLIRSGAYKYVRHPIYTGLISGGFGWALFVNGSLTLFYALLLTGLLDLKARYEERLLRSKFESYAGYQRDVARFIPFLY